MGIKIPRVLTAQLDAINAARVASSGVKFDKLLMTTSGQPIFAKDEETATEIRATFVIDLSLIRSFGRGESGLSPEQKTFVIAFALWKIVQLLQNPFSYRSGCDLEFKALIVDGGEPTKTLPAIPIKDYMTNGVFTGNPEERITKVYWKKEDLFKKAKDKKDTSDENPNGADVEDEPAEPEEEL
jgi:CRISPR-associated protein Csb1